MTVRRPLRVLTLLGAVLALLLLGGAGPAFAHADLREADPADGTVLKSAPSTVTLTYSESVALLDDSFRLFDPEGRRVRTKPPRHVPGRSNTAQVEFPDGLGEGTFTVAWRVISADGHPVSGALTFSVGKPSPAAPVVDTGPDQHPVTGTLYDLGRYTAYGAAALLIGMVAFILLCRPPNPRLLRGPLAVSWWAALASTLVLLVLRAPYETGTGPMTAFDPAAVSRTLSSRPGLVLTARLALLVPTAVFLVRLFRRRPGQEPTRATLAAGAVPALALALTLAASEHASAGIQVPVAMTSSTLHVLAMGVWLGGLTALLTILQRVTEDEPRTAAPAGDPNAGAPDRSQDVSPVPSPDPSRDVSPADDGPALTAAVARFSRIAFGAVTVLVATGIYQSWRGLGSWAALTGTAYGRLLLVKVAVVVLMLAVAGLSRRWTARLAAVDGEAAVRAGKPQAVARARVPVPAGGKRLSGAEESGTEEPGAEEAAAGEVPAEEAPAGEGLAKEASAGKAPAGKPTSSPAPDVCRRALRRSVLTEVAVGIAVLVVTTMLVSTLPGRVAAEAENAPPAGGAPGASLTMIPFDVGTPGGHGKVQVTLVPGRVGQNAVEAVVYGPDGGLSIVPELRLSLSLPEQKLGPIDAKLIKRGGYWSTDTLNLPVAGEWTMKATVRVSEIDQVSAERKVRILR